MSYNPSSRFLQAMTSVLMCLPIVFGCSGCSNRSNKLTFVVRTGLESEGLRKVAESYTLKTGVKVDVQELGRDGYLSTVPSQLVARVATFDVAFLPSTMIAELAAANAILPLDTYMDTADRDIIATYGYKGKTYAIPTDMSAMFMYYRKDLISTPPETWDDLSKVAKKFTKTINPGSPTDYGLAFPGMAGEELPKAFYCVLWSFGGSLIEKGRIGIGDPSSIVAAAAYRGFVDQSLVPKDLTSWGFAQIYENLESGRLAIAAPFWNAAASLLLKSKSPYRDRIAWALVPGVRQADGSVLRVPFQHAWTLAVNARSKDPQLAARFIEFATGKEGGRIYAEAVSGNPARYSVLGAPDLQHTRPEFKLLLESLRIARAEPATPKYAAMHNVLNEALTRVLASKDEPGDIMRAAREKLVQLGLEHD